jgi:plasmid stabilization system protein ParE
MFRVEWLQTALNQLTSIWTDADSVVRQAITAAGNRIDQQLQSDPYSGSESRPGGRRIAFVSPLGILFRVEQDGQTVTVLRVWLFRKRTP